MLPYHEESFASDPAQDWRYHCPYPRHGADDDLSQDPLQPRKEGTASNSVEEVVCRVPACSQPVIPCPDCGTINRSFARFCRHCRAGLSYASLLKSRLEGRQIDQNLFSEGVRQINLPGVQPGAISALASGWGYLVFVAAGWGIGLMANTALRPPRLHKHFREPKIGHVVRVHTVNHPELLPGFFIVGQRAIYRITPLPEWRCECVFRLTDQTWRLDDSVVTGRHLVVRLLHSDSEWYRWLRIDGHSQKVTILAMQQRGAASGMIGLADEGWVFYHTEKDMVFLNVLGNSEHRRPGPACGFNVSVRPHLHPASGEIFLQGRDAFVYGCKYKDPKRRPERFTHTPREVVHIYSSGLEDHIYLLCRDDVFGVKDSTGEESWNLSRQIDSRVYCGAHRPCGHGRYLIFTCRLPASGAQPRVVLLPLDTREDLFKLHPETASSPLPVWGLSSLVAVRNPPAKGGGQAAFLVLNLRND